MFNYVSKFSGKMSISMYVGFWTEMKVIKLLSIEMIKSILKECASLV